jgi:hypothetical protein
VPLIEPIEDRTLKISDPQVTRTTIEYHLPNYRNPRRKKLLQHFDVRKMDNSLDRLLRDCGDKDVKSCLLKIKQKGTTLQRSAFTKLTKDNLCDTLIFIATSLFGALDEDDNFLDASSSVTGAQDELDTNNRSKANNDENEEKINDDENGEIVNDDEKEEKKSICQLYRQNRCPSGNKGNCSQDHPKPCRKFLRGGRTKDGCTNWKCPFFHPKICLNSYLFGSCLKPSCKERHTRTNRVGTSGSDQSFLWQKQLQVQIDKIAEMNLMIVRTLNLNHQQKTVQMWDRAPPTQTPRQPRWPPSNQQ